ncbi:uncharacterized protein LOC100879309 [Megachile rotundata]|uniref:uncharacterized protein LOC100879309 n=1 Tax=Megachile rotundata TaxID=143995 RepID=UPI000614D049|nr:PREDICTED: uncharacterized protein LOC100879309 [Megachile rotundata]
MERICLAILVAMCSGSSGQWSPDWVSGLSRNIEALNRNIQENVRQVNLGVQEAVRGSLEQARQATNEKLISGDVQIIGGNNAIVSNQDGVKFVRSGHTSDGKPYTRESSEQIVGDVLRHVLKVYYPATNTTAVHGYTLDLKDPNAKPVPINGDK